MNKRKLLTLAMTLCMVAILAIGGTLAYFTDKDAQTNVFTTGNVLIDLWEDFGDNNEETLEKLMPATYDENGKRKQDNCIEKEIYVTNEGSESAYVRIHFAIPTILDDGDPTFDASENVLHWNYYYTEDGQWNWTPDVGEDGEDGDPSNDKDWNFYTTQIAGKDYNVYVATYETALTKNQTTENAVWQVYLDKDTTNSDISTINGVLGTQWKIYVAAEGTQAAGFADAYEALNTSFGVPGNYNVEWTAVTSGASDENPNKTFVHLD